MDKQLAGRRMLIVEDEMLIQMMIEDMLADLGCEHVATAATADQAIGYASEQEFDAALLDLNLFGRNSYPVARELDSRGVPFAFSTGNSVLDVDEMYRQREFLRKPFQLRDLSRVLARLLPA